MRREESTLPLALLRRVVDVRDEEVGAMLLACFYFFFLLASWYILRPVRDEMGVAGGVGNLAWLFSGTLVANPLFALLIARYRVKRFVRITYRFFIVNLLVFFTLLAFASERQNVLIGRAFFVWTSVFNLFVVSVFWAFMADVFRSEQSKRLFAFIGFGGTLGGTVGTGVTAVLAKGIGTINLLLVSAFGTSLIAPLAIVWLVVSLWLGRRQLSLWLGRRQLAFTLK